jgi:hypothetical protein
MLATVETRRNGCERCGPFAIARLLSECGSDLLTPEYRRIVAGDCLRMRAEELSVTGRLKGPSPRQAVVVEQPHKRSEQIQCRDDQPAVVSIVAVWPHDADSGGYRPPCCRHECVVFGSRLGRCGLFALQPSIWISRNRCHVFPVLSLRAGTNYLTCNDYALCFFKPLSSSKRQTVRYGRSALWRVRARRR